MKIKGLVLEVQKNSVTVLTPDGEFRRLPKRGAVNVGDEYSYSTFNFYPLTGVAAAITVLLVSGLILASLSNPLTVAEPPKGGEPSGDGLIVAREEANREEENSQNEENQLGEALEETVEPAQGEDAPLPPQEEEANEPPAPPAPPVEGESTQPPVESEEQEPAPEVEGNQEEAAASEEEEEPAPTGEEEGEEIPEEPVIVPAEAEDDEETGPLFKEALRKIRDWYLNLVQ